MSATDSTTSPVLVEEPLSLKELGAVLVRHYGLKEGLYEPMVQFMIGTGNVGPSPESVAPSAVVGVSKIGLFRVFAPTVNTVDAAQIAQKKTLRKRVLKERQ